MRLSIIIRAGRNGAELQGGWFLDDKQTASGGVSGASTATDNETFFRESARCIDGLRTAGLPGSAITYLDELERNLQGLSRTLGVNPDVWTGTATAAPT